jgi:tRNA nucleotidyltransferase (CCA-adding enzyme)
MDTIIWEERRQGAVVRVSDLAIGGRDVIAELGIGPGPMVGMVLSQLLQAVVDGEVANTREALLTELWRSAQEHE